MDLEFPTTAGEISRFLDAKLVGDPQALVHSLSPLESAAEGSLTYLADRRFRSRVESARGSVLVTSEEFVDEKLPVTFLVVTQPKVAFARVAQQLAFTTPFEGISKLSEIDPSAEISENVSIGPFTVVCAGAKIGPGTIIYSHSYLGPHVSVGADCEIRSRVTLEEGTSVGNRVKICSGAVLGSEGFGMIRASDGSHTEMPQVGRVVVEDSVRIGANCTIDRGTIGETRIGEGTKLDDQVHVGHNTRIGKNCIVCGHVGLSGSVVLGDRVIIGGQAGVSDHVEIGDDAVLGGQTGVGTNLKGGEMYSHSPALPVREAHRLFRFSRKLPELWERLKRIEERLDADNKDQP